MLLRRPALVVALALALPLPALALNQPDGTPIPQGNNLRDFLTGEGDGSIDVVGAAATTPQTFDPACNLKFKVVGRGGSQMNSFGWYNATGSKPDPSDLHEFLTCDDPVGTEKTLSIQTDPAYKGGKIGFFQATTEGKDGNCVKFGPGGPDPATLGYLYYSEPQYNEDNTGAGSYIHLLVYDSKAYPKAFYFGWEDLFAGGDNDFEDLLTRVEGITCSGGGEACVVAGAMGLCAQGVRQCSGGQLACLPLSQPEPEACNGIDDDCNGSVDDGKALCPDGYLCVKGSCVGSCATGEFPCAGALSCDQATGYCVEPGCVGKQCEAGQVCRGGACTAPCLGVTCPHGQVCRNDVCVDPCTGVTCPGDQVCAGGVCQDRCGCGSCGEGKACAPSGKCVDVGCEASTCTAGQACVKGACLDGCSGAVCPGGQACVGGQCTGQGSGGAPAQGGGGSPGGGASPSGGQQGATAGKGGSSAGASGAAGKAGGKKVTSSPIIESEPADDGAGGCGCRASSQGNAHLVAAGAGLVAALVARRRRRAR